MSIVVSSCQSDQHLKQNETTMARTIHVQYAKENIHCDLFSCLLFFTPAFSACDTAMLFFAEPHNAYRIKETHCTLLAYSWVLLVTQCDNIE